ncbi:PREDICTED: uncharacterized protein LOC103906137 [Aptenodytes forsteri]|nr:PREDICTED: uncharacterized protein LOC103906137 [Aptenodytes forsteri]
MGGTAVGGPGIRWQVSKTLAQRWLCRVLQKRWCPRGPSGVRWPRLIPGAVMETGKKSRAPSGRVWAKPCSMQELKIVTRLSPPSPAFAPPFDPLGIPMDGGMRRSLRGWGSEWDAPSLWLLAEVASGDVFPLELGQWPAGTRPCRRYSPSASGFSRGPHLARQARCWGLDVLLNIVLRHHRCVFFCGAEGLSTPLFVFQDTQEKETVTPERAEEAKLKAKYPNLGQKPGGSDFLMKRLQKGQKYFDSGDYNMAKAKMKNKQLPSAGPDKNLVTGDHIPTPQDLPQRKSSLVTSKLAG